MVKTTRPTIVDKKDLVSKPAPVRAAPKRATVRRVEEEESEVEVEIPKTHIVEEQFVVRREVPAEEYEAHV